MSLRGPVYLPLRRGAKRRVGVDNGADGFDELMDGMDGLCIHTLWVYR